LAEHLNEQQMYISTDVTAKNPDIENQKMTSDITEKNCDIRPDIAPDITVFSG
jgi:hypothetical protein